MSTTTNTRRSFLRSLGLGAAALAAPRPATAAGEARRPNVVVLLTDDQGWGDVHGHGNEKLDTPVMDRLAAEGASFDRFFVSPVCAPTRAAFLTGRYPRRTGVSGVSRGFETLRADEVTIAEALQAGGYATACFGKWHNGAHYPHHPNGQGFGEYLGICCGHWNNYFDIAMDHNGVPVQTSGYVNDVLTDAAMDFMARHRRRPFFVTLAYNTPHSPMQVPDRFFAKYKQRGLDDRLAAVYGMVESLDECFGRLLAHLGRLGLDRDTIVLFFTDNGPNGSRYNGGMRGHKGSVHEGGVRVPLFVRWPGRIPAGLRVEPIAAHIDLWPTLVELTGVPRPETKPLDGRSLAPLLRGEEVAWPDRMIFTERGRRGAVRTQRYRLVVQGKKAQLYDMTADPGETTDVADRHPDVTRRLHQAYQRWWKEVSAADAGRPPIPVGYEQSKVVEMPTPEGTWGGGLKFGGRFANNNWLTGWTSTDAFVAWHIDVVHPGPYEVVLKYICPAADLGSRIRAEADGRTIEGTLEKAQEPNVVPSPDRVPRKEVPARRWALWSLGTLELPEGRTRLTVKASHIPGKAAMDLKAVLLRRLP
ncbi:MAG: arylsulfatase [Candidatus Brocadiia bacterium]